MIRNFSVYLIAVLLFIVLNLMYFRTQNHITYNDNKGWDGVEYYKITEQITAGNEINAKAPYVYRIGTPLLVALISPENIHTGFKVINLIANLVLLLSFIYWMNLFIRDNFIKIVIIFFLLIQWHATFRFIWFYNIYVDPIFLSLFQILLILNYKYQRKESLVVFLAICLLTVIGVLFREAILIIPFSFLFVSNVLNIKKIKVLLREQSYFQYIKDFRIKLVTPLLLGILTIILVQFEINPTNNYSFVTTGISWLYQKSIIQYILGIYQSFGPIIIIIIFFWKDTWHFLKGHHNISIILITISFLGYVGGSDTERIIFWTFPITYLLIGLTIENNRYILKFKGLLVILCLLQMISSRIFWTIPDFPLYDISYAIPFFTLMSNKVNYLDLLAYHSDKYYSFIFFIQYILITLLLLVILYRIKIKVS